MKTANLALLALLLPLPAFAACPAGQSEMLTARLYFGQQMNGKPVAPSAWRDFLARNLTPLFPDGLTVFDAQGQWRDGATHAITREPSKVVEIASRDTSEFRARIEKIRAIYSARFHQQFVGLLTFAACGTF